MPFNKYTRLKIAGLSLQEDIQDMAAEWDVSTTTVRGVCEGTITSQRISKCVDKKIICGEKSFDEYRKNNVIAA